MPDAYGASCDLFDELGFVGGVELVDVLVVVAQEVVLHQDGGEEQEDGLDTEHE
jgi:hypothetical protein